jgi:hypothetical protein
MSEPNYSQGIGIFGGHLKDIPRPRIYLFPNPVTKRKVTIRIMRYAGFPHYWLSIIEEENALWDSSQDAWVRPWDHEKLKRLSSRHEYSYPELTTTEFMSHNDAITMAKKIIKKYLKNYEVIWDDWESDNRSPEREGD